MIAQPELYDLQTDLGETADVATAHPDKVRQLLAFTEKMRTELGDVLQQRQGQGVREPDRMVTVPHSPPDGAAVNAVARFRSRLGLQLYSLRAQLSSNPAKALDLVKSWGITDVEIGGIGELPREKVSALLRERGLKPVSLLLGYDRLQTDLDGVIREAKIFGVIHVLCASVPRKRGPIDAEAGRQHAARFNEWGAAFKAAGIQFGYHLHGYELGPVSPGGEGDDRVVDLLIRATDPGLVTFEMDVFWVYHAGVDPAALLKKYPGRWFALHLKDLRRSAPRETRPVLPMDRVAIGRGAIDWVAVLRAAEVAGVSRYFIEDEGVAPLEDVPASLAYLRQLEF